MSTFELYEIADEYDVTIFEWNCDLSLHTNDKDYIAVSGNDLTESEYKEKLAHELGHCTTGSFYNIYSKLDVIAKSEYKANWQKIKWLVPIEKLKSLINSGMREYCEFAEEFDVSTEAIQEAFGFYRRKGHLI